jgi:hypothetical protein
MWGTVTRCFPVGPSADEEKGQLLGLVLDDPSWARCWRGEGSGAVPGAGRPHLGQMLTRRRVSCWAWYWTTPAWPDAGEEKGQVLGLVLDDPSWARC